MEGGGLGEERERGDVLNVLVWKKYAHKEASGGGASV